ncbi:MAG: hypothetical protein JSU94_16705 [Phycisphaerales bacterium]|nr:MAG: hypothetical protein JSU94_16705 [Phycisphaerales bacterium]
MIDGQLTRGLACVVLLLAGGPARFVGASDEELRARYEGSIKVTARATKRAYEPNEPVPLEIAIENHASQPVYISWEDPRRLGLTVRVKDANGTVVTGGPVPTPPPAPVHWYMERDGRQILVTPVTEIEGGAALEALIPDAMKHYHAYISEGVYYLAPHDLPVIHEVGPLIVREDQSHKLWIDPQSPKTTFHHKVNEVKIEIRKGPPGEVAIDKSGAGAGRPRWAMVFICTLGGAGVVAVVVLLMKRAASRAKG